MLKFARRRSDRTSVGDESESPNKSGKITNSAVTDRTSESGSHAKHDKSDVGEIPIGGTKKPLTLRHFQGETKKPSSPIHSQGGAKVPLSPRHSQNIQRLRKTKSREERQMEGNVSVETHGNDLPSQFKINKKVKSNVEDDSGIDMLLGNNLIQRTDSNATDTSSIENSLLSDFDDVIQEGTDSLKRSQQNANRVDYRTFDFQSGMTAEEFQEIKRSMRRNKGPSEGFRLSCGSALTQESTDHTRRSSTDKRTSKMRENGSDNKPPRTGSNPSLNGSVKDKLHKANSSGTRSDRSGSIPSGGSNLVIPSDGNLSSFSVEQMATFFKYLSLGDPIISKMKRHGVDGRKFSRTSDKDMEAITGIRHPILVYFRDRSKPPAVKSSNKNAFLL